MLVETILNPAVGDIPLQSFQVSDVRKFIADEQADGYSPASIRHHLSILSSALELAVEDGLVGRNVVALVRGKGRGKPQMPDPKVRVEANTLSQQEASALIDEAEKLTERYGPQYHAFYACALRWGLRASELAGLLWDDVDIDKEMVVTVRHSLDLPDDDGKVAIGATKTGDKGIRKIPIGNERKLLIAHRLHQNELKIANGKHYVKYDFGAFVFARQPEHLIEPGDKLGQPIYLASRGPGRLDMLTKAEGINKRITPHGLRDTCASLMHEQGVPLAVISQRLGHTKVSMTLDRYISPAKDGQQKATAQFDELFG